MLRVKQWLCVLLVIASPTIAEAQLASTSSPMTPNDLQITVTSAGTSDFTLTPLWFAFQNGGFDLFDTGVAPTPGLELLAEDGAVASADPLVTTITSEFDAAGQPGNRQGVVLAPGGFGGAPVIEPGEAGTAYITPINPANYQYFSFASMVIPSNDTFIGNENPTQYQAFTPSGDINDPSGVFTIQIFGSDVYDAGTEENNAMGAAFSTNGGMPTDTNDGVGPAGDLSEFLNTTTPSGLTITDFIDSGELVATITITQLPEPSTLGIALLAVSGLAVARKRKMGNR
jgi:hypothetical protein